MVTNAEINNEKTVSEKPIVIRHKKKYARKKTTAKIILTFNQFPIYVSENQFM